MNTKVVNIALSQYGIKEIPGINDNPEVLKYFNEIGFDGAKLKDETAWCSAFANWVISKSEGLGSCKLNARSWLNVGEKTTQPEIGDIVVLWRDSKESWKGHVGFYINSDNDYIYILGGNQNNQVNIKPYRKNRLLEYRRV